MHMESKMLKTILLFFLITQIFGKHAENSKISDVDGNGEDASKRFFFPGILSCDGSSRDKIAQLEDDDEVEEETSRRSLFIFPGTKWCGAGNNAKHQGDLGKRSDVDSCCKAHDNCPIHVSALKSKYGCTNYSPITVSDCKCDEEFHECLKAVTRNKKTAWFVGNFYFDVLRMPCLKFDGNSMTARKGKNPRFK